MRVVDCHVHIAGPVEASELLRSMDAGSVERILVISEYERSSAADARAKLRQAQLLVRQAPERIGALAWLNPAMAGSEVLAREALEGLGFSGIKVIPDHWFAYEERLDPFWRALDRLCASVLFHTGILHVFDDGSRFCHPVYLERLVHFPRVRFAMAHLSWPWCDECLAVMGRMRSAAEEGRRTWQSYIDTTPGTPPYIRTRALGNAVAFCGTDRLLFGSDSEIPGDLAHQREVLAADLEEYRAMGLKDAQIERIFSGTADELFPMR